MNSPNTRINITWVRIEPQITDFLGYWWSGDYHCKTRGYLNNWFTMKTSQYQDTVENEQRKTKYQILHSILLTSKFKSLIPTSSAPENSLCKNLQMGPTNAKKEKNEQCPMSGSQVQLAIVPRLLQSGPLLLFMRGNVHKHLYDIRSHSALGTEQSSSSQGHFIW